MLDENERPSNNAEETLKTMKILEAAWNSSMNNMMPINYN